MNKDMMERLEELLEQIMDHDGGVKTLKSYGFSVVASVHVLATGVTYLTSPEFPGFVVTCENDLGPMLGGNVPFLDILVIGKDKCPGKHGHWEGYDNLVALFDTELNNNTEEQEETTMSEASCEDVFEMAKAAHQNGQMEFVARRGRVEFFRAPGIAPTWVLAVKDGITYDLIVGKDGGFPVLWQERIDGVLYDVVPDIVGVEHVVSSDEVSLVKDGNVSVRLTGDKPGVYRGDDLVIPFKEGNYTYVRRHPDIYDVMLNGVKYAEMWPGNRLGILSVEDQGVYEIGTTCINHLLSM